MNDITESYEENKTKGKIVLEHCIQCGRRNRHMIVSSYDHHYHDACGGGAFSIDWSIAHQIIQCQGCMSSSFREIRWHSEDVQHIGKELIDDGERITLYPKRSNNHIAIKEFREVPLNLRQIYRESIESFNNNSYILTAAGLRALIEGLCEVLDVRDGPKLITKSNGTSEIKRFKNLEGKLSGLYEKGFLTEHNASILHEHRFMGNDAVHELAYPSRDELVLAITIIEHTFDTIFEIPAKGDELKSRRDIRVNKTRKNN